MALPTDRRGNRKKNRQVEILCMTRACGKKEWSKKNFPKQHTFSPLRTEINLNYMQYLLSSFKYGNFITKKVCICQDILYQLWC